jgi:hypothetical protein
MEYIDPQKQRQEQQRQEQLRIQEQKRQAKLREEQNHQNQIKRGKSGANPYAPASSTSYQSTSLAKANPPALPKYSQLNLFGFHGIDPNLFRTPLTFMGSQPPLWGHQEQEHNSYWQSRQAQRNQQQQEREEKYKYNQLDWLAPEPKQPLKVTQVTDPKAGWMSREAQERQIKAGTLNSDFDGLRAISDYMMAAHPADLLPHGANLDEWLAKAQAFKTEQNGVQVASARVQGHGARPETPVEQFQHRLKDGAIHRLEQNKARLTQVQGSYQNTQPGNEQWSTLRALANRDQQLKRMQDQTNQELMTLIAKKEFSNTPLGRLANQTPLGKVLDLPKSDPIQNGFLLNVLGTSPQDVDPKYREQFSELRGRLSILYSVRQEMWAVHPALAVVDTYVVSKMANTEWNNSVIYREMGQGFNGMRSDMTKLSQTVAQDPSKALLFDALKLDTLKTFTNPVERQQAQDWVKQQEDKDGTLKAVLGVGALGLTAGGMLAGPLGWSATAARGLLFGGSVLGTALAAHEFPQLIVMDLAAKAGAAGGDKLTHQTPEEARMNLALGYANLAIAGLDLGLMPGLIGKVVQIPGAVRSAASLTRKQSQVWVNSIARHSGTLTDAALEKLLQGVRTAEESTTLIVVNGDMTLTAANPLKNLRQKLETTVDTRASGRVARSVEGYENAATVKSLVGKKFNLSQLPEGYKYAKIPLEDGSVREVIYLPKSNNKMVPLEIDKDGLVQVGAKGEYRVVRDKYYNKNFETIPGEKGTKVFKGKGNSWIHHMVPDNVMRSDPLYQRAFELGIFNPDRTSNLIELAADKDVLQAGRKLLAKEHPEVKVSDFTHYSQHPKYDRLVQTQIEDALKQLKQQHGFTQMKDNDFIMQMKPDEIKSALTGLEKRLRRGLMGEDRQLYKQIKILTRDNGSLAERLDTNTNVDFA